MYMNAVKVFAVFAVFAAMVLAGSGTALAMTDEKVRNFIDSFEEIQELAQEYDDLDELSAEADDPENMGMHSRPFSHALESSRGHEFYPKVESLVKGYGFSGAQDWGETGDQVFQAYFALKMQEEDDMQAEMQQALQEIESSPLPEEQKTRMKEMIKQQIASVQSFSDVSQSHLEIVRAHKSELDQVFGYQDE